jgi:antitoxin (DNA-binding transcriptional repressor) of toxin-antitoxin stability system
MRTIPASTARTYFYRILDDVELGESIQISRNGRVVARVEPLPEEETAAAIPENAQPQEQ